MTALLLAAIGVAEGVVYTLRYRSAATDRAWYSGCMAGLTTLLRIGVILLGASAVVQDQVLLAIAAYVPSATAATVATHIVIARRRSTG